MRLAACFAGMASVLLLFGCSSDESSSTTTDQANQPGESCWSGPCSAGECVDIGKHEFYSSSLCLVECERDSDCPSTAPVCGLGPLEDGVCLPECEQLRNGLVCVDGTPTVCDVVDDHCDECGCAEDLRCDSGGECMPLSEEGEPCRNDDDCLTGNCSEFHNVCRTPLGFPCDETNCDRCLLAEDWSFCSRYCDDVGCNDGLCLGNSFENDFICKPACESSNDPSCPGSCRLSDSGDWYCDVTSSVHPPMPLGAVCHANDECASGDCGFVEWCALFEGCTWGEGYCTTTCSSDAECGDGLVCVDIPCADEDDSHCGSKCLRQCGAGEESPFDPVCSVEYGTCSNFSHVSDGEPVQACDVRLPEGYLCRDGSSCRSGRCEQEECFPEAGQPNGEPCEANSDCLNGVCTSGLCRGSALLGDDCSIEADCAVGDCCDGNTCCN